eukprot:1666034-Rhodomonas_salina.1
MMCDDDDDDDDVMMMMMMAVPRQRMAVLRQRMAVLRQRMAGTGRYRMGRIRLHKLRMPPYRPTECPVLISSVALPIYLWTSLYRATEFLVLTWAYHPIRSDATPLCDA